MTKNEAIRILGDTMLCTPLGQAAFVGIEAIKEVQQYRLSGTVNECLEAREKQRGKKPIVLNKGKVISQGQMFVANYFKCPNCGIKQAYFDGMPKYCDNCGQKLEEGVTE